jgi:hypothetical protein
LRTRPTSRSIGETLLTNAARIAGKIALGLTAIPVFLILAAALINSFDVPLSDQAQALLTPPPNPYPSNDNLYLAIAGLEGAAERPITAMGQERVETFNRALDSMLLNPEAALNFSRKWESTKLSFNGKLPLGPQRTTSIWTDAKSHRQDIANARDSNGILYRRYLSLHHLHGYYETARPSYTGLPVYAPQAVRILFLAEVANSIQTGTEPQQRAALTDLQLDLQTWRRVLKGQGTLIGKMLAAAYLHADSILLADFVTDPASDLKPLEDLLGSTLQPFDLADYRIGNAFAAEYRAIALVYQTITPKNELIGTDLPLRWRQRMANAIQAHFFKPNATKNMSAAITAQAIAIGNSVPGELQENRRRYHEWLDKNEPHLSPAFLYNPMGKIQANLSVVQYESYPLRVYDVAAYQRMVYLVFQLKRQHIVTDDVAAFLRAHPEWSTHPVDGKPFHWNAGTGELAVNTLGEHPKDQRFSVILR